MRDSTITEVIGALESALQRLYLDDLDEQDVEKALNKIEDAKNQLQE